MDPLQIGQSRPRGDAAAKVAGREPYAADAYPDNRLWARAVRPGVPSGRIVGLACDAALAVPGVVKVLRAGDVPGSNRQGIVHKDMPVLADDRVRCCADAVALVLAESPAAAAAGAAAVAVEIEPLPGVYDLDAALAEAAHLVHADRPGNLLARATIRKGDGADPLARCDVVVEGTFTTPVQAHAFLETESGVARLQPDGTLWMQVSTQSPFRDRFEIGHALSIPYDRIHIEAPCLGGGFGGKDGATVQCLLGLAALHADGRPVKMVWDREESFVAGYKRHACRLHYRLGARRDGTLQALHARIWYDTGAYAHLGAEVMELGMEHAAGPYRIPHALIEGWCVHTHNPTAGAMRAFGVCQVSFAFESMMDLLAQRLGMDPLALRTANALVRGDTNCAGIHLETSTGIKACLAQVARHPLWREREIWRRQAPPFKRRGVGLAAVFNAAGYGGGVRDAAIAKIEMDPTGHFIVHNAVSDMGQGNSSAFMQMAGHLLGQTADRLRIRQPDTRTAYPSGSSSAGRTTYTFGRALTFACETLKSRLLNRAGLMLFLQDDDDLVLEPDRVRHIPTDRSVTLAQLGAMMSAEERVCLGQFVAPTCKPVPDTATGFFIGFPHVIFSYSAHLARVEIDTLSGVVQVTNYLAVTDGGHVINPAMFHQQIQGGVAQGIGYALYEDFITHHGRVRTEDFTTYIIPGALDLPEIVSVACVEETEATGPFGMKGIGEVAMNGPLPAIANGVADAGMGRICRAPLTPERVLDNGVRAPATAQLQK
ncbi:xanthine dehydrogenase family protein molybdopterin-binding subunit [Desulfatitalea alkaliphila]|uniref:Xanthine dehydrogenase family protein molybdopterin-binding subunit n=1 Tax=Desulfatitalea alkaliphila TaxID=2929485 RepID=A0AA41R0Y7_9BACT|nr:xanthine dehydrogenase family protein molybdopterin-binding subunit [Desulfatitalea alkaliphila]MCJ8499180.1 xanthine dehydrogenase family protein molybdopterin-binding subunit [Desulfatitalea alkaliphila]